MKATHIRERVNPKSKIKVKDELDLINKRISRRPNFAPVIFENDQTCVFVGSVSLHRNLATHNSGRMGPLRRPCPSSSPLTARPNLQSSARSTNPGICTPAFSFPFLFKPFHAACNETHFHRFFIFIFNRVCARKYIHHSPFRIPFTPNLVLI